MTKVLNKMGWLAIALLGAFALGVVALRRGESINAIWLVAADISVYLIAYRYYSLFIAERVLQLDPRRVTPAVRYEHGCGTLLEEFLLGIRSYQPVQLPRGLQPSPRPFCIRVRAM
jgi:hypothetical protein